jgi:hypothetical protein
VISVFRRVKFTNGVDNDAALSRMKANSSHKPKQDESQGHGWRRAKVQHLVLERFRLPAVPDEIAGH